MFCERQLAHLSLLTFNQRLQQEGSQQETGRRQHRKFETWERNNIQRRYCTVYSFVYKSM